MDDISAIWEKITQDGTPGQHCPLTVEDFQNPDRIQDKAENMSIGDLRVKSTSHIDDGLRIPNICQRAAKQLRKGANALRELKKSPRERAKVSWYG